MAKGVYLSFFNFAGPYERTAPAPGGGGAPDPIVAVGLLAHENQLSVMHMVVQKCAEYEDAIKSKTPLVCHLGFRRFSARPIYSDHNINSDKSKLQRYLANGFAVATGESSMPTLFAFERRTQQTAVHVACVVWNEDTQYCSNTAYAMGGGTYHI